MAKYIGVNDVIFWGNFFDKNKEKIAYLEELYKYTELGKVNFFLFLRKAQLEKNMLEDIAKRKNKENKKLDRFI